DPHFLAAGQCRFRRGTPEPRWPQGTVCRTVHSARDAHRRVPLGHAPLWRARGEASRPASAALRAAPTRDAPLMRVLGFIAPALLAASSLEAQGIREFSSTRQDHGESRLATVVRYTGGTLTLRPAPSGILYSLRLTYDADRVQPL